MTCTKKATYKPDPYQYIVYLENLDNIGYNDTGSEFGSCNTNFILMAKLMLSDRRLSDCKDTLLSSQTTVEDVVLLPDITLHLSTIFKSSIMNTVIGNDNLDVAPWVVEMKSAIKPYMDGLEFTPCTISITDGKKVELSLDGNELCLYTFVEQSVFKNRNLVDYNLAKVRLTRDSVKGLYELFDRAITITKDLIHYCDIGINVDKLIVGEDIRLDDSLFEIDGEVVNRRGSYTDNRLYANHYLYVKSDTSTDELNRAYIQLCHSMDIYITNEYNYIDSDEDEDADSRLRLQQYERDYSRLMAIAKSFDEPIYYGTYNIDTHWDRLPSNIKGYQF